jgi:putative ABC transport system permease protein
MVIVEAVIVGFVGSIIGIVFGFAMALGIRSLMSAIGIGISSAPLVLLPRTVIVGMAVGMILTVASALLPARKRWPRGCDWIHRCIRTGAAGSKAAR